MDSKTVVIKGFGGVPLVKKVVYSTEKVVFATSESVLELIKNGQKDIFPIGFPAESVFVYDGRDLTGKINWKTLEPWHG